MKTTGTALGAGTAITGGGTLFGHYQQWIGEWGLTIGLLLTVVGLVFTYRANKLKTEELKLKRHELGLDNG